MEPAEERPVISPLTSEVPTDIVCCPACNSNSGSYITKTLDFCYETCRNEFEYVSCTECGQVFLRNRPDIRFLDTIYPSAYISNDYRTHLGWMIASLRSMFERRKVEVLRRLLKSNDIVVEVGAGGGDYLDLVRRFGDPTWEVMAIEFSSAAARSIRSRGISVIESRVENVDWCERPAGAFVMHQLIEHVEDPRRVLTRCFQALRDGGIVILETPSLQGWDAKLFPKRYWAGWHAPRHWCLFDESTASALAVEVGFEVISKEYTLSPFIVLHTLQYMLRERYGLSRLGRLFDVNHLIPLVTACAVDQLFLWLGVKTSNMRVVLRKPTTASAAPLPSLNRA